MKNCFMLNLFSKSMIFQKLSKLVGGGAYKLNFSQEMVADPIFLLWNFRSWDILKIRKICE